MTTLSFDLHVWPWLSIYLNKCFKMHCYSSRRTTVPNYFEIHPPMRSNGRRMHTHTLHAHTLDWNCKTLSHSPQAGSTNRFIAKLWHHENALIIDLWPHPGAWPKIWDNWLLWKCYRGIMNQIYEKKWYVVMEVHGPSCVTLTFNLLTKCFKWHFYMLRKTNVPNNLKFILRCRCYGPGKFGWNHAHTYTELNCKTFLVHRKQTQQRGLMQNSDIMKMPKS